MMRAVRALCVIGVAMAAMACQSPTSASSTSNVDNFVDASVTPNPTAAAASTDGRTYRVVRGNNQPDDILPYQYTASFSVTLTLNANATNSSNNIKFPVTVTATTSKVEQASNGIITAPTSGETEHYDSIIQSSTTNTISQVGGGATMVFKVWYALPNNGKEALITENISMKDSSDSPQSFSKSVQVRVAP